MWNVFKMLLVPAWLLLAKLKLAFRFAAGAAAFVLAITGGLLLVYDLFLLIIGLGSKELILQLLTVSGNEAPCVICFDSGTIPSAIRRVSSF